LSDAVDRGITVTELAPMEQAIDVSRETTAAFVGRALRGPLDEPVLVNDFGEFRRRFGESWSRSSLGPAVRQFFEHGGRRLYIVRVANSARGAMLCLPASGSALVLRAVEPGSTECIRAAVDLDGIEDDEHFNLTLQRVDPETGHILDQELHRRVSVVEESAAFVVDVLLNSSLARVEHPYPTHRPEVTRGPTAAFDDAYTEQAQRGADGHELSDYDLIGSRHNCTSLFALRELEQLDLLYLPPPGKERDLGPATLLAAELFCREHGAMLIVDPAQDWMTPEVAVSGVRDLGLASPNTICYFPRMHIRNEEDEAPRAIGGALAGLLCKLDRTFGAWQALDQQGMGFSRDLVPAQDVDDDADMQSLAREGLNIVSAGPAGRARLQGSVTMGRGSESHRQFASLPVRRLCLQIVNSIDLGTRWAVFEPQDARIAKRITAQVTAYLAALSNMGAFASERFVAECEAGVCPHTDNPERGVTILITFHPLGCREPVSFTLHQTSAGCRVTTTAFAPVIDDCA
jgi:hypothetical protein